MEAFWQMLGLVIVLGVFAGMLYGWIAAIVSASRRGRTGWVVVIVLFPVAAAAWWLTRGRDAPANSGRSDEAPTEVNG